MFTFSLVCATCGEITGQIGLPSEPTQAQIDSHRESECGNGHRSIGVQVGDTLRMPTELPPADPVEGVASQFAGAKAYAGNALNTLMASVAVAMMMGGMSESDTNAAGSAFVVQHSSLIQAWLLTGANHVAGQALLTAITADPPAWWSEPIAAIFAAALA